MTPQYRQSTRRWAGLAVTVSALAAAVLAAIGGLGLAEGDGPPAWRIERDDPPTCVFAETTPAADMASLTLIVDPRKVLGWISGSQSHAGREVTVRLAGRTETVLVQEDNTFTWHYAVAAETPAEFGVDKLTRQVTLRPRPKDKPTVFFVVDRTVYRPGHELKFAGFLRQGGAAGEFEPLPNREVEIILRSQQKKTVAAKMKLTSDELGRVVGSYTFQPEDALDEYTLSIPGHLGEAVVKLAEFRKAKVRLEITGKREAKALRLRLEGRDFLDKPVPAQRVQFTAIVWRRAAAARADAMNAEEFVYHVEPLGPLPDPEDLSDEEMFLWSQTGTLPPRGEAALAQFTQTIQLNGEPAGEYDLPLKAQWLDGRCEVVVSAVLVDQNGREQRAAKSIPLKVEAAGGRRLAVRLSKWQYAAAEPVGVMVRVLDPNGRALPCPPDTSVTVLRKSYQAGGGYGAPAYQSSRAYYANQAYIPSQWEVAYPLRSARPAWTLYQQARPWSAEVVDARVVRDGRADVSLAEAGLYQFLAVAHLPSGGTLRAAADCSVLPSARQTPIVLRLDAGAYECGETLTGEVHCRYRDARVLLTVRDSRGVRLWRSFQMTGAAARFAQRLPVGLRYGCSVVVQCIDGEGRARAAQESIRIRPADRILDVKTDVKKVCDPGENVKLKVKVGQAGPVDLVVSVYDQSLLGVARNKSPDIRNFYLADDRALAGATDDLLQRELGDLTVEDVIQRAQELLKAQPGEPEAKLAAAVCQVHNTRTFRASQLAQMIQLAGVPARHFNWSGEHWYFQLGSDKAARHRLVDVLRHKVNDWSLACRFYDGVLVIADDHPSYHNSPYWQRRWGYAYDGYRSLARGDARYSMSANAMYSVSAQSFISHMPAPSQGPMVELAPDAGGPIAVRRDFSDSALFNARLRTDANGEAAVQFKLPDSLTNWHVVVTAISPDMRVGHVTDSFRTYKPIMVWPMIPRVFTHGDKVRLFARVHNRTDRPQLIRVKLKGLEGNVLGRDTEMVTVQPNDSASVYWTYHPTQPGFTQLLMTAECEAGSDASLKRIPVVPSCAVEQVVTASGFCRDRAFFDIPRDALDGFASLDITLVPSLAADMADTLEYLVGYPHGCVEQTMSRFLPCVKVAGILKRANIRHQALADKLPGYVEAGVKRLIQLQRPDGGWGWNGQGATHEMMTPYALYGLLEAEREGYQIGNDSAIESGLGRLRQFIDAMGDKQTADRVYCLYVYTLRKPTQDAWWAFIEQRLDKDGLSDYAAALALEMAARSNRKALARRLAERLGKTACKVDDGVCWKTAGFSRWGDDPFEVTAAVLKALVAHNADDPLIEGILSYLAATKQGNRWNSTKDTAMILFALCDYLAKKDFRAGAGSTVALSVNGGQAHRVELTGGLMKKLTIPAGQLRRGRNEVRFAQAGGGMMYRLVFRYHKVSGEVPAFANGLEVTRTLHLMDSNGRPGRQVQPGETVPRGSYLLATVTARRLDGMGMRYVLVESPKPSCCEIVPADDKRMPQSSTAYVLREDRTAGVLFHHESTGGSLQDQAVFHAELAGEYVVPPAYVELMYQPELRGHSGTFRFKVGEEDER